MAQVLEPPQEARHKGTWGSMAGALLAVIGAAPT